MSSDITWQRGRVSPEDRARIFKQLSATVWMTGLPGSGKSTLAFELERILIQAGHVCFVLDGDNIRHGLNGDLGFTREERRENIRRIAEVARLINDAGLIVIAAFISPYRSDRQTAREIIGPDRFIETFLAADLSTCESRDPRGLYAKARNGQIRGFTGIDSPYEMPEDPTLLLDTASCTIEDCCARILETLSPRCFLDDRIIRACNK